MADYVDAVAGRDPRAMKPSFEPLLRALEALNQPAGLCTFIGDSATDIEAAGSAGIPIVALANKKHKRAAVENVGCKVVVDSMQGLI